MQAVYEVLAELDERVGFRWPPPYFRPVGCMQIFADIMPSSATFGKRILKGRTLLAHRVAAVVDQHVDAGNLRGERLEESPVTLVADAM